MSHRSIAWAAPTRASEDNGEPLAAMRPTAYLINVARGGLIDEAALIDGLTGRRIAGAGLDALTVEPPPEDSPLWRLPNVIITPHMSAITERLGEHFVAFWSDNIRRFAEGEPRRGLIDKQAATEIDRPPRPAS